MSRDLPILFSPPMINAILDGRKTMTRRILPVQLKGDVPADASWAPDNGFKKDCLAGRTWALHSPYHGARRLHAVVKVRFAPGDRIWVRETYYQVGHWKPVRGERTKGGRQKWRFVPDRPEISFDEPASFRTSRSATFPGVPCWHKRLGRFMPRAASRLTLIVEAVKIERLHEISYADVYAEGAITEEWLEWRDDVSCIAMPEGGQIEGERDVFARLWKSLHGSESWDSNPVVVALSFRVIRANIDAPEARAA